MKPIEAWAATRDGEFRIAFKDEFAVDEYNYVGPQYDKNIRRGKIPVIVAPADEYDVVPKGECFACHKRRMKNDRSRSAN